MVVEGNCIEIAQETIGPGRSQVLEIPVSRLPTQTMLSLPVTVINGEQPGKKLWLSAAIHGDELNGVEIIRRVLTKIQPKQLRGTLIAVPIVNVFGFVEQSRYLPDRRDLNRSFPGSAKGSLASRLANLFMQEIVSQCDYGIDLHTAAIHRVNLPQIRANLEDKRTYECAKAFAPEIVIHATTRDGSLRQAATKRGIPVLLYEAGEALRFDYHAIAKGVSGIFRVMNHLDMFDYPEGNCPKVSQEARRTKWVRASRGGIFHLSVALGQKVRKKDKLGTITDAFGQSNYTIKASSDGIVISYTLNPLVNQGDAIVHLAIC